MKKRMVAQFLTALMSLGLLTGCLGTGSQQTPPPAVSGEGTQTPSVSPSAEAEPSAEPMKEMIDIAIADPLLGMGAAKLMADDENGSSVNDYTFTIYTDRDEAVAALTNGDVDIAAIAANTASELYNKTNGAIKLIAINTCGAWELLQSGDGKDITDISGLADKTVYAAGQGEDAEYVLKYLLAQKGLDPAEDVDIRWMTVSEVTEGIRSGAAEFAVLPVPAAAAACIQGEGKVRPVLDLAEQWSRVNDDCEPVTGCVVVRTEFAETSPGSVRSFLQEYETSIAYMSDPEKLLLSDKMAPVRLLERYGIVPQAEVAMEALPQADLTCISGIKELRDSIQGYYEALFSVSPASVGGGIPDDAFYFE